MIRVLIIEDEIPAQINLKRLLAQNIEEVEVVHCVGSIEGACSFLAEHNNDIDLIFMDIELSDGTSFEILNRVKVTAKIIVTTAFDNYAIRAFKINSIDYLLKPINPDELVEAVRRARDSAENTVNMEQMLSLLKPKEYKQRFVTKVGDRIIVLNIAQIAYFYSEDKVTFVVTFENKRYIIDQSLDMIIEILDPKQFFRISRSCIASINSIKSVNRHLNSRLKVTLQPQLDGEVFVSRLRTPEFMSWLES